MIVNFHYIDKAGNNFVDLLNNLAVSLYNFGIAKNTRIFHYTPHSSLENILKYDSLWFSDSTFLNDKTEGLYVAELFYGYLDELNIHEELFPKFKDEIRRYIRLNDNKFFYAKTLNGEFSKTSPESKYFICSFSLERDSLSMWNYYTKTSNKSGYNLSFLNSKLYKSITNSLVQKGFNSVSLNIYKVLYDKKKQKHFLKGILLLTYEKWKESEFSRQYILADLADLLYNLKYIFKHSDFKMEREIRIVIQVTEKEFQDHLKKGVIKIRTTDYGFVPYIDLSFNKTDLKSITASPLTPNYSSVNNLLKFYNYKKVLVDKSNIPLRY